jgi:hypothetical protein
MEQNEKLDNDNFGQAIEEEIGIFDNENNTPTGETITPSGVTGATGETGKSDVTGVTTKGTTGLTGSTAATSTSGPTGPTGEEEIKEEDVFAGATSATSVTGVADTVKKGEFDYQSIAKEIGIEMTKNNKEEFINGIKKRIEDASKKTELDLSSYNPETRSFIEGIEQPDSSLLEMMSPITGLDHYLVNTNPEQIVTDYLIDVEKLNISDARSKVADLISSEEFEDKYKQITNSYNNLKLSMTKDLMTKIQKASDLRKSEMNNNLQKEKNEMIDVVKQTETFLGLKIPETVKANLIAEINSGVLTKENNNARTQVNARLFNLYSQNLKKYYDSKIKEASRKAYNEGATSIKKDLHNVPPSGEHGAASSTDYSRKNEDGPLAGFLGIEDEIGLDEK